MPQIDADPRGAGDSPRRGSAAAVVRAAAETTTARKQAYRDTLKDTEDSPQDYAVMPNARSKASSSASSLDTLLFTHMLL
jgi:hypothetical protein